MFMFVENEPGLINTRTYLFVDRQALDHKVKHRNK